MASSGGQWVVIMNVAKSTQTVECSHTSREYLKIHVCVCATFCVLFSLNIKVAKCALIENTCKIYGNTVAHIHTYIYTKHTQRTLLEDTDTSQTNRSKPITLTENLNQREGQRESESKLIRIYERESNCFLLKQYGRKCCTSTWPPCQHVAELIK